MAIKKHTPWFIEVIIPVEPMALIHKASWDFINLVGLCKKYNIDYKRQYNNCTKVNVPGRYRLYFNSEEDLNAIRIMR